MTTGEDRSPGGGSAPWPPEWAGPAVARNVAAVVFLAAFGCVGLVAGLSIFLPGPHDSRAYLLVLAAPLLFGVAGIIVFTRLRVRRRPTTAVHSADDGEPALVIPYSRGLAVTYVLVCAATLTLFAVVAVVSLIALVATGSGAALLTQTVIGFAFVLYLGWTLAEIGRGRLRRGAVIVTRSGVRHRSWAFDSYLPWDHAVSVSAGDLDGQLITLAAYTNARPETILRSRLWRQPEYRLAPHTAIRGRYLSVDPGLAYHTLRFYHQNSAARAELGTAAALARIRSGRF